MVEEYLKIGRTTKLHGAAGELKMIIEEPYLDFIEAGKFIFIEQEGKPVPFFIEQVRGGADPIVKLEWIESPQEALPLTSKTIYLLKREIEEDLQALADENDLSLLQGFKVLDSSGAFIGMITEITRFPQQLMATVEDDEKNIHLIPLHADLIEHIDVEKRKVVMNLPEGILDL